MSARPWPAKRHVARHRHAALAIATRQQRTLELIVELKQRQNVLNSRLKKDLNEDSPGKGKAPGILGRAAWLIKRVPVRLLTPWP